MKAFFGDIPVPFRHVLALFALTAALTLFIGARTQTQGQWMPVLPATIDDVWALTETPLDEATLAQLGHPQAEGACYINPYNERVNAHVIAAASIDAFHEPAICMAGYGYTMTAQKYIPLFGSNKKVRALVLRNDATGQRILLYYWVQDQQGYTSTESSFRAYQDYASRMNRGLHALGGGQQCIVRAYTEIHPADPDGRQARRNLTEVAQNLYATLRKDNGLTLTEGSTASQKDGNQ